MLTLVLLLWLSMLHHSEGELRRIIRKSRVALHSDMRLSDRLAPERVVHPVGVVDRIRGTRHRHVAHPVHTTQPHVSDVLVHTRLRHGHLVILLSLHVAHPTRSGGARLVVGLVLGGKTLGRSLDLLVRLLLWLLLLLLWLLLLWLLLLGGGRGGTGRGGRRVTLGVGVAALVHYRVLAIPIFERDQYAHVQMCKKLGGGTRVWGWKLLW